MTGCYVGIDIGTTNTKAVILYTDGTVEAPLKAATPFYASHGAVFFDLSLLEEIIIGFKKKIQKRCRILGISFSSVGESVVPVGNGKALSDPLFWNDPVTEKTAGQTPIYNEDCNPELNRQGQTNATLSIYKIIWMRDTLGIEEPEFWLPLSSYFIYRFTGKPFYDYSQATRTLLMNIGAGKWDTELLQRFHLENRLPPLCTMESPAGEDKEHIAYALGGHDHLAGLFCIETLVEKQPFIFDSIGSSESLVTLTNSRKQRSNTGGICIGAFAPGRFYALNSIINSGILMKWIARLGGSEDPGAFFESVNARILNRITPPEKIFPIIAGGDPVAGLERSCLSLVNIPLDTDIVHLTHTAYVYMATMARLNIETLRDYTDPAALIIAGGGGTANSLYLQYRAAILNCPVYIIQTTEMSGTGASLCAASAMEDKKTIAAFRQKHGFKALQPDFKWDGCIKSQSDELASFYRSSPFQSALPLLFR